MYSNNIKKDTTPVPIKVKQRQSLIYSYSSLAMMPSVKDDLFSRWQRTQQWLILFYLIEKCNALPSNKHCDIIPLSPGDHFRPFPASSPVGIVSQRIFGHYHDWQYMVSEWCASVITRTEKRSTGDNFLTQHQNISERCAPRRRNFTLEFDLSQTI